MTTSSTSSLDTISQESLLSFLAHLSPVELSGLAQSNPSEIRRQIREKTGEPSPQAEPDSEQASEAAATESSNLRLAALNWSQLPSSQRVSLQAILSRFLPSHSQSSLWSQLESEAPLTD